MNEIGKRIADKLAEIYGSKYFSIAFLPYKRSMWNSMASVCEECKKAGVRTFVIPLPYIRRSMQDGSEILDIDEFEDSTNREHLSELSLDFVVIHYPYDGNNKVTRMLPKYYTAELRKYGKVVYIPYSCTNMRQLRVQPGLANIDYAFLGSEDEAESFISEWNELGIDFSGKVFGYGSPKMDAILKLKHEHNPGEKFVTLVINSLGPYLQAPFERIRLYQHYISNEIGAGHAVIFRPHPLLRQTIKSMRPDTMAAYEKFISWCETRDHVEVDESEYLEDALEQADFLISDPSSVLEMWISTGREYRLI
jgi:hypothetical protein